MFHPSTFLFIPSIACIIKKEILFFDQLDDNDINDNYFVQIYEQKYACFKKKWGWAL